MCISVEMKLWQFRVCSGEDYLRSPDIQGSLVASCGRVTLEREKGVQDQHNANLMKDNTMLGLEEAWQGSEISLCFVGSTVLYR